MVKPNDEMEIPPCFIWYSFKLLTLNVCCRFLPGKSKMAAFRPIFCPTPEQQHSHKFCSWKSRLSAWVTLVFTPFYFQIMPINLSKFLSFYLHIYIWVKYYMYNYLSIYLSLYLSIFLSTRPWRCYFWRFPLSNSENQD